MIIGRTRRIQWKQVSRYRWEARIGAIRICSIAAKPGKEFYWVETAGLYENLLCLLDKDRYDVLRSNCFYSFKFIKDFVRETFWELYTSLHSKMVIE